MQSVSTLLQYSGVVDPDVTLPFLTRDVTPRSLQTCVCVCCVCVCVCVCVHVAGICVLIRSILCNCIPRREIVKSHSIGWILFE